MQIGELATLCGVRIDTVRYYEKQQLLVPTGRTDSGYRIYSDVALRELKFILRAKSLGFTLREIRELLTLKVDRDNQPCSSVKDLAEAKLEDIEEKLSELTRMHRALTKITGACCGGDEPATACSILDALDHEENGHGAN
ncbi:zinc-responsive transcriptional regulator [Gammaproteobacteria bacterium 45_16_T64]|nr:zinc-responsive transcriptional regulator [Gammaproteobacteria bacterium 45_16_T64]